MQANPNVDDWQSTLDVCGSCFRTIQREGGLVQAPYLSNEKQRQVHALILDKQCTWREYRSKRLHDFGCHQLCFVSQLARSHAASIAAPCSASLEQVRGRSPAEGCACVRACMFIGWYGPCAHLRMHADRLTTFAGMAVDKHVLNISY